MSSALMYFLIPFWFGLIADSPLPAGPEDHNRFLSSKGLRQPTIPYLAPSPKTAGAEVCRLDPVVELGPTSSGEPVLGFGPGGGLAAWKSDEKTLALRFLASNGALQGSLVELSIDKRHEPKMIFPIRRDFVVLLVLWDWQRKEAKWFGVFVSGNGRTVKPGVDLGLASMDVSIGRVVSDRQIALIVRPAAIAPERDKLRGRWQTIQVGVDGSLTSTAVAAEVDDLVTTTQDRWVAARLADRHGWVVLRDGVRRPFGLFAGHRSPASKAVLIEDDFVARVYNMATPPPPGPDGTIYEAMPRPALVRVHNGKKVGKDTRLEVNGNPVGVLGITMSSTVVWSGTHFVYPFASYESPPTASLLPIDCRKAPVDHMKK